MNLHLQPRNTNVVQVVVLLVVFLIISVVNGLVFNLSPKAITSTSETALDPFMELDELAILTTVISEQNYLVYADQTNSNDRIRRLVLVPLIYDVDFLELVTVIETELWRHGDFEFKTEFDENQAKLYLSSQGYEYQLIIEELTPYSQDIVHAESQPKLAIVIDDWGYPSQYAALFIDYPFQLTTAILPYLAQSIYLAEEAEAHGHEVILHQPMEAVNTYLDIGSGGITGSMTSDQIAEQIEQNLEYLPMIKGVNNHMGSRTTADLEAMKVILEIIKRKDLYFLDSLTTPISVTQELAPEIGVPYAINNHFIDNINQVEAVKSELRFVIEKAKRNGVAIAIGHVRPATALALWEMIPEFVEDGVKLVPVSELLKGTN